ncbi:MAG TPA: UDP-N-acetylmuramoyl-L-alanine--D-glutamate ligase [Burkholderiales bacterium]|nr:UDP-N-acetylmuramoyl-L-alanine--D-glutamate ligase [Burkholderiales bacterium]
MDLSGRRVLVLGLGETGLSVARWVAREGGAVRVADTRAVPPALASLRAALPQAEVLTGPFNDALLQGVALVAASPGVPIAEPVVQAALARGLEVVGDIELFARFLARERSARSIAITGTNGKSTVTALAGSMCRAAGLDCEVAGNISPAVLTALLGRLEAGRLPEIWVLELSSFQLETTRSLAADAATVLNVSADHLDRYPSVEAYAAAKACVFERCKVQVLNRDDRYSAAMRRPGERAVTFGLDPAPAHEDFGLLKVFGEHWLAMGGTPLVPMRELKLAGLHNAANALAALALCRAVGLPLAPLIGALKGFAGLPHRVERVSEIGGVQFYDDSKGTNVGSTVAALAGLARQLNGSGGKVVLIAGGEGKQQDFAPLRAAIADAAHTVVLIGRDAPLIEAAIAGSGAEIARATSMTDAVALAFDAARPGDIVLLSPACASFDMFRDYKERGDVFAAAVRELAHARAR